MTAIRVHLPTRAAEALWKSQYGAFVAAWTPDHSRRARGFATYAAFRELGRAGLRDLIARCCRHARGIVTRIGALPSAQAVCVPQINQGLVQFLDPRPGATPCS